MKKTLLCAAFIVSSLGASYLGWIGHKYHSAMDSTIISEKNATKINEDWGHIFIYTSETSTETFGTQNTLSAMAVIKPGREIHPPHQHTAEEFMYILEGEGTWSLNGKTSQAKAGDMLYASPWDMHGITNTGDVPLKFFVVKFDNKGLPMPKK